VPRIAIIGGGISGLSAAVALEEARRQGAAVEYALLESSERLGGVLRTEHVEGCVVEAGPDSFLTEKSWAADYCRELGLGDQLIVSNDAQRKTYIVVRGRMVPIPDGLQFLVPTRILPVALSPLFSFRTKLRMAREYFSAANGAAVSEDESVAQLVERHYGHEMVERLADPLLAGVYGGDAASLSASAVLPRFVELERRFGSLSRGMLEVRKTARRAHPRSPSTPRPIFTSLRNGMQQLSDAAAARLTPAAIQLSNPVRALQRQADGWRVISKHSANEIFDAVIVATPAPIAGSLLEMVDGALASELRKINYSSSITVVFGFERRALANAPVGFGFLVPRAEGRHMLACTFVHNKFPHRAPPDKAVVRCFLGGARNDSALDMRDEDLLRIVLEELRELAGMDVATMNDEPLFSRVYRWPRAMAQYGIGHQQRIARIGQLLEEHRGLRLAGNAYRGIGIPDCIASGQQAAKEVLGELAG
jgi:oxygen-dependent protoporphyrinogen oxidase